MFGSQHQDIGLDTNALQFFYRVLCGLCLQLFGCCKVGYISKVYTQGLSSQFPFELPDTFQERQALDITHGTTDFCNHEVIVVFLAEQHHIALDFIGDVRYHLYGLAQIVASALLVDDRLVDAACGEVVGLAGLYAREAFIVPQVKVSLMSVGCHIALAMLIRVKCTRVNVDIRVKLLDGDVVSSCLKKLSN